MLGPLLERDYDGSFEDSQDYQPATIHLLKGLAAAIQDSHPTWRPTISELANIIRSLDHSDADSLVLAGVAYGTAKQLSAHFSGVALLLFTSAIESVTDYPKTELRVSIERARAKIRQTPLADDPDIRATLEAAFHAASFDHVRKKQIQALTDGLLAHGKYSLSRIQEVSGEIVEASAQVRHKGKVVRFGFMESIEPAGGWNFYEEEEVDECTGDTGLIFLNEKGDELIAVDYHQFLVPYAQFGSAYVILERTKALFERSESK